MIWSGKSEYHYEVGDSKPENDTFFRVLSVSDKDKNLTNSDAEIIWQEGALTQDGKLNAGEWIVTITVSDSADNVATHKVKVIVIDRTLVKVEIDGQETSETYHLGDYIAKPIENPTKDSTAEYDYTFDGWYVGDVKWDFANDVVKGDTALTAKFIATAKIYTVKIVGEGLAQGYEYTFRLTYGAELSKDLLTRDGYTYKLYLDEAEKSRLTVTGNVTYRVVYTEISSDTPDSSDSSQDSSNGGQASSSDTQDSSSISQSSSNDTPDSSSDTPDSSNSSVNSSNSSSSSANSSVNSSSSSSSSENSRKSGCFGGISALSSLSIGMAIIALFKKKRGGK